MKRISMTTSRSSSSSSSSYYSSVVLLLVVAAVAINQFVDAAFQHQHVKQPDVGYGVQDSFSGGGQRTPGFKRYYYQPPASSQSTPQYRRYYQQQQPRPHPQQESFDSLLLEPSVNGIASPYTSSSSLSSSNSIILNNNDYDQFRKYKTFNNRPRFTNQPPSTPQDLNNLLVSIQNIRPSLNEERLLNDDSYYLRPFNHNFDDDLPSQQEQLLDDAARSLLFLQQQQQQAKLPTLQQHKQAIGANRKSIADNQQQQQSTRHQTLFREENMAIPYDEIEQQTFKRQQAKPDDNKNDQEKFTKVRRTNTNQQSSMMIDKHMVRSPKAYQQPITNQKESMFSNLSDIYFIAIVACISTVAIFSVIGAGYCFYKVQQSNKAAADVDFPAYGVIGPASRNHDGTNNSSKCVSPSNDRKLVQSAQIYHYHHQKQQMISTEKNSNIPTKNNQSNSDIESDEENEDGEYTVYECPGLAPTGEMEIKNPLFQDDLTPMSSPSVSNGTPAATTNTTTKTAATPKNSSEKTSNSSNQSTATSGKVAGK